MRAITEALEVMTSDSLQTLLGRVFRYGVAGVASAVLYTLTTALLVEVVTVDPVISSLLATSLTVVFSYIANHRWVFASTRDHTSSFFRFVAATCLALLLNAVVMYLVVHVAGHWYGLGMLLVILIVTPTNFAVNYFWCFRAPRARASQKHAVPE